MNASASGDMPHQPSRFPVGRGASRAVVHPSRSATRANTSCALTNPQCR